MITISTTILYSCHSGLRALWYFCFPCLDLFYVVCFIFNNTNTSIAFWYNRQNTIYCQKENQLHMVSQWFYIQCLTLWRLVSCCILSIHQVLYPSFRSIPICCKRSFLFIPKYEVLGVLRFWLLLWHCCEAHSRCYQDEVINCGLWPLSSGSLTELTAFLF